MNTHRNHLMSDAYASMYLNEEQIDEIAPLAAAIAPLAGKAAGALAGKAAGAGAAKIGGGVAKAATSKLGQSAIKSGSNMVADKVTNKLSNNEEYEAEESYTASYMEAYKKLPQHKMQDKAAMKPDTAKGESQARKMDTVRKATKAFPDVVKGAVKGQQLDNNKAGLEKRFAKPSADKGAKNKAYKLENQRRQDLNKRYGPKKEDVVDFLFNNGYALSEESAEVLAVHISDEFLDTICEEISNLFEGNADNGVSGDEAMKRHGITPHEGSMKVKKLKPRGMRKGEGLGVGARKRQGAGKPDQQGRGGPVRFQ